VAQDHERQYVLERPNREKASSKATRSVVILLLLVSAVLVLVVTLGGWSKLQGAQVVQIAYIVVYAVMAFYVSRWNRGVLPVAAALAIVLGIFAAVGGPEWFARDKSGFATPEAIWGGTGLGAGVLGLVTLLIVPVQVLLIAFSMQGFRQDWHVEVEVPADEARPRGGGRGARPATA
jgi:presenilin-like A22 family membrane protease